MYLRSIKRKIKKKIADQLVIDQRTHFALKNDYSEGEELDKVVKNFIETI